MGQLLRSMSWSVGAWGGSESIFSIVGNRRKVKRRNGETELI